VQGLVLAVYGSVFEIQSLSVIWMVFWGLWFYI